MTDPREEVVEALLVVTQNSLRTLRNGSFDLSPFEIPREALFQRLVALDTELGAASAPLLERLARLEVLNDALLVELQSALKETEERLKGVMKGRRGLSGYLDAAAGAGLGAKLGRG